jgi:hypothetical protein
VVVNEFVGNELRDLAHCDTTECEKAPGLFTVRPSARVAFSSAQN